MMRSLPPTLLVVGLATGAVATGLALHTPSADGQAEAGSVRLAEAARRLELCEGVASKPDARATGSCTHLIYVWSSSMPLSVEGLGELREALEPSDAGLSVLPVTELVEPAADPSLEALRIALVEAGATVHFPSLVVTDGGRPVGRAMLGYKRAEAWRGLIAERLATGSPDRGATTSRDVTASSRDGGTSSRDIEVLWTHVVEPPPGAFFRRVPGTSYISFDQRRAVHLRDLVSGRQFRGPGWIDFVPTPDGRLFVTPGPSNSGLEFYLAREVMEGAADGSSEDVDAFLVDRQMSDQYPSVGILEKDEEAARTRYRILVSWFAGLAFRDYDVRWSDAGPPEVEALTEKLTACPGMDLSIPILSKDGREVAARDESTGTTKIFRLADDASCTEVLDLGRQTSKVGFSDDGMLVAYSTPERSSTFSGTRSRTWVLDRRTKETVEVPHSVSAGLVIPELVGSDSLLIAVKEGPRSSSSEFRLLCCVR